MIKPIHLSASKLFALFYFLFFYGISLNAQIEVEPTGTLFTPEDLITNVFLGDGVTVTNITYNGDNLAVGYFTNGTNDVGMDRGIVMASGFATTAATADTGGGTTGDTNGAMPADPDITAITTSTPQDIAIYEITFIPINDTLRFKYAFASEEYPEYACSGFNDVFGFFVSGPGINGPFSNNGINIAFVPDPADPSGTTFTNLPVTINNVNPGVVGANGTLNYCTPPNGSLAYSEYYNDNVGSNSLTYDGILDVFIAQVVVIPCEEYTIKLAICDAGDASFDSAVFLEAKSFGTGSLEVEVNTVSLDGTMAEGCSDGSLTFSLPNNVENDFHIDYTIFGTATNGVDYEFIPNDIFIPAGDSSVSVPIIPIDDGMVEGLEYIAVDVQRDVCTRDTFFIYIKESIIIPPELPDDTTICRLDSVYLDGTLNIPLPSPPTFTNETDYPIVLIDLNNPPPPGTPPTISEIEVFGVQPSFLQENVIKSICINVDHSYDSDIDVYLVAPGGQFLELSTDNGGGGNDYIETCFTPEATDTIHFGGQAPESAAPFTGDWYPEGNFADLWDGENPTNGTWTLQIKDDAQGFPGTLLDWTICFYPLYQLDYQWTPSAGLSCDDCPDPMAAPDTTTTYYLTVTDSYGCEVYDSITITVLDILPPPVISCTGVSSNSINFTWEEIPDATGGYQVSIDGGPWINPSPGPLNHFISGLNLNTDVTIAIQGIALCNGEIDSLTCTTIDCTPPAFQVDDITSLDCYGDTNGNITVSASGMFPPFTYMIAGVDTNSTGIFTNLPGGNYTVIVSDMGNCSAFINAEVIEPQALATQEMIISNVSCSGQGNASATFEVSGGSSPYSFMWNNGSTDSITTNLTLGIYEATITDAQGCSVVDSLEIVEPSPILLSEMTQAVSCNGNADGTATVIASGGTMPYTYLWDGGQSSPTATNLSGGNYTVTVTDAQGCSSEITMPVQENPPMSVNLTASDALCFDSNDGTAMAVASGGTGGTYTYLWDDPMMQTTELASNLAPGTYNVVVSDSVGCTATASLSIMAPETLQSSIINQSDALCNGAVDGQVSLSVSGGVYPYSYSWSDNANLTDSLRNDLPAGIYTFFITDANGCTHSQDVFIGEPDIITIDFTVNNVACNGGTDGSVMAMVAGGTAPYAYLWDAVANNQTTPEAVNLSAGQYSLTVTDANNCTAEAIVELEGISIIALTFNNSNIECSGYQTGSIDMQISGGASPYSYAWTGPGSFAASSEDLEDLYAGTYAITVTDANGCIQEDSTTLTEPAALMALVETQPVSCFGDENGIISIEAIGGTAPYQYRIEDSEFSSTNVVIGLDAGDYLVAVVDVNACEWSTMVEVEEPPEFNLYLGPDITFQVGEHMPYQLSSYVENQQGDYTVTWLPPYDGILYCNTVNDNVVCPRPWIDIDYTTTFAAVAIDSMGCEARDEITVTIDKYRPVLVPTAFTPNGDGVNDLLRVHGRDGSMVEMFRIYDRWGALVFEARDFPINSTTVGWDGYFKSQLMNPGTYVWYIEVVHIDGVKENFTGHTTILR